MYRRRFGHLSGQDATEFVPLAFVVNKETTISADLLQNFNDFAERTSRATQLRTSGEREASFSAILEHNKQLDSEGDWLDAQGVNFIDACRNRVILREVGQVLDTMSLPLTQHTDQLCSCSGTRNIKGQGTDFRS
jgi:hypothetical protein